MSFQAENIAARSKIADFRWFLQGFGKVKGAESLSQPENISSVQKDLSQHMRMYISVSSEFELKVLTLMLSMLGVTIVRHDIPK